MKRTFQTLVMGLVFLSYPIYGDDRIDVTRQDVGSETMAEPKQDDNAYRIAARADWITRTKIDKKGFHKDHVEFYLVEAQGEGIVYYNESCKEGLSLGLGYSNVGFRWKQNPYFTTDNFNLISFTVSGFSERISNWLWNAYVTMNWQPDYSDFYDYSSYDLMLWGRYEYIPNTIHIHSGFFVQTGMKVDRIWPIIGFDWKFMEKWKLNAVFPVNISIEYEYSQNWSAALAGRMFNLRYRVGKNERIKEAIFEYYNYGAELAANYANGSFIANIHAGTTFGGQFKISNRQHRRKRHFDMNATPYFGGELAFKF